MATCCWLVALLSWRRAAGCTSELLRLGLALVLAVLGGLCKESGFCVLLQLTVLEALGSKPLRCLPPLAMFGAVFLARSWVTGGTEAGFSFVDTPVQYQSDVFVRIFTYLYFHAKYAQLMVLPWTLSWDYSYDALPELLGTWRDLRVLAILATYLAVCGLAAWGFSTRNRKLLLGLSNILIPFVPASNLFFVVGVTIGERLLYPCNVGAAIVLAAIGSSTNASARHWIGRRPRLFAVGMLWLAMFVWMSRLRTYQWSSRELLFSADAESYPQSTKSRHQLGTVLYKMERFDEALHHFHASEKIFDGSGLTQYCIAQILIETGRADEARVRFESIFNGNRLGFGAHNSWALYVDYGFSLMMLRRFPEALTHLRQGLALNEDVPHGLNALGYSLMHLSQPGEAKDAFERGLKYEAENPYITNNLGVTLILTGQLDRGALLIAAAAKKEPRVPAFAHNVILLNKLADEGRWPEDQHLVLELFYNRGN